MPLLTLLNSDGGDSGGGGGGSTTTNYALLLALTSDVEVTPPPTGTTNYALLLALTSEAGETPPPQVFGRSYGGLGHPVMPDPNHKKKREEIEPAPPPFVEPEDPARVRREALEAEELEFIMFLLDNHHTLH